MPNKKQELEKLLKTNGIPLAMPISHLSALSNVDNINQVIQSIQQYTDKSHPVVGFDIVKGIGVRERNYRLLSKERADSIKEENHSFHYITWEQAISRKSEINMGKYKINNGTIVGICPEYT